MNITALQLSYMDKDPPPHTHIVNTVVNILSQLPSVTITTVRDLFCN